MSRADRKYESHIRSYPCWTKREAYLAGYRKALENAVEEVMAFGESDIAEAIRKLEE